MALPYGMIPNVFADVYRGITLNAPYPPDGTQAVAYAVPGYLKHHVKNGRFGKTGANLHWTHLLYLDPNAKAKGDPRDAYNAELGPGIAEVVTNGDTILLGAYPIDGRCCAFWVVDVVRKDAGQGVFFQVYLDRLQPRIGNCTQPTSSTVNVNCAGCLVMPATFKITMSGVTNGSCVSCTSYNGTHLMNYVGGCVWQTTEIDPCIGGAPMYKLYYDGANWNVVAGNSENGWAISPAGFSCMGTTHLNGGLGSLRCGTWPQTITITPG